eukprot:172212-Chlamydomonas_euryale.AAC.1
MPRGSGRSMPRVCGRFMPWGSGRSMPRVHGHFAAPHFAAPHSPLRHDRYLLVHAVPPVDVGLVRVLLCDVVVVLARVDAAGGAREATRAAGVGEVRGKSHVQQVWERCAGSHVCSRCGRGVREATCAAGVGDVRGKPRVQQVWERCAGSH